MRTLSPFALLLICLSAFMLAMAAFSWVVSLFIDGTRDEEQYRSGYGDPGGAKGRIR